jgi:hypothetical protein
MQTFVYLCNVINAREGLKSKRSMKSLKSAIKEIARKNPEGFTVSLPTLKAVTEGIAVSYLETQNSFNDQGLENVLSHALSNSKVVGGWLNIENGKYYYDSCRIFTNRNEAIEFGKANKQIAIFDITNLELIKL